jgi:hypothetical protein
VGHVSGWVHNWNRHIKPRADARYYTKVAAEARYYNVGETAANAQNAANADNLDTLDSTAFARAPGEAFREVGTAGQPVFHDGTEGDCQWGNFDSGHSSAGFFKDAFGVVHLKGVVDSDDAGGGTCDHFGGSNDNPIFTLPEGYRPPVRSVLSTITDHPDAFRINVDSNGVVSVEGALVNAPSVENWVTLDGLTFRAS